MLSKVFGFLSTHPEVGVGGAAVTVASSNTVTLQLIATVLGILIAIVTLVIKIAELIIKIRKMKNPVVDIGYEEDPKKDDEDDGES